MTDLPVREMVLYKHGVGFFIRAGAVSGEKAALTFRKDEINDVLKSLAVFDMGGGQVLGLHYQTPMDRDARLASSSIRLANHASVRDLLRDLRGRQAILDFETTPGSIETVEGRIIGLDDPSENRKVEELPDALISMLAENGGVRVFRLSALRSIQIQDSQSEHDLSYFLDTSMSEDERRIVNVRLSEGDHDLVVHYVAPSPTWRVSYRVVAESDESGDTGKALLQGWGLFDNRLEEDLEDVQVTLVAGQPISFIYELYASRIPERPLVEDESRIAPGPVEFEAALARVGGVPEVNYMDVDAEMAAAPAPRKFAALQYRRSEAGSMGVAAQSTPAQTETKEAGEFFQYIVKNPVSVKRGESALVPIHGSEIKYNRELLYNGKKLPNHPVVAMRFDNTTGLTLERGPVTVVEDSDYKGEAVVPFTQDGNEVYLPYAVELGIQITEKMQHSAKTIGVHIEGAFLKFDIYNIIEVTYTIENKTAKDRTILIEAAISRGYELVDTPAPEVETASEYRWKVQSPARRKTTFVKSERMRTYNQTQIRKLTYKNLQSYLENRWLDKALFDELSAILDMIASIEKIQVERGKLEAERGTIYQKQEQIRANLQTLQPAGQEANLRNRMLSQLESTQNRLEEIDRTMQELVQLEADTEKQIEEGIAALGK